MPRGATPSSKSQTAGPIVKAKQGAAARAASHPYFNSNLAPVDSKSDWAMGVAHAHASDKAVYEDRIEMLHMQLASVGTALEKHAGRAEVEKAKREGEAHFRMTQSLKSFNTGAGQPQELADYGTDDDDDAAGNADAAGKAGKAGKAAKGGGRPAGFSPKNAYILFTMDFQKEVKSDEVLCQAMKDRYQWSGAWSQGGAKGEKVVTFMQVQGGEWDRLKAATDDESKARVAKYVAAAAALKEEANRAFEEYKELLKTDPAKAAAFQKERTDKSKESDAVAQ